MRVDPRNSTPMPEGPARSTRRAMLVGLIAAPAAAAPGLAALADRPSDLARACHWAADRCNERQDFDFTEGWSEDRWEAEESVTEAVFERAIREPSASARDLAAKARLLLDDMRRMNRFSAGNDPLDRLCAVVLTEVIALGPAAPL